MLQTQPFWQFWQRPESEHISLVHQSRKRFKRKQEIAEDSQEEIPMVDAGTSQVEADLENTSGDLAERENRENRITEDTDEKEDFSAEETEESDSYGEETEDTLKNTEETAGAGTETQVMENETESASAEAASAPNLIFLRKHKWNGR